jgi:hypothetical protein
MRRLLLAAGAVLAFGGSAFAQEPTWSGEARIVGFLVAAAPRCPDYQPKVMSLMADRLLTELNGMGVSDEKARVWMDDGAKSFDDDEASKGASFVCRRAGQMLLDAYKTWAKYHLPPPGGQR